MYTVYQHIFPNGKRYVGLTRNQVEKRWGYRGSNYKRQPLVWNAIQKYGWENIEHDIFALCETKDQAERVERWLIKYHDTTNPLCGYNVLPGGDVAVNDATPEMRYKLGNGNRGKTYTEEQKQKISEGVKRKFSRPESNGCFGKRASEETKEKMRKARREYLSDSDNMEAQRSRSSGVMKKLWEDDTFRQESLERLSKYRRKPGEYSWSEEAKAKLSATLKGKWVGDKSPCAKAVVCLTKDGEFVARYGSTAEAARAVGAYTSNISRACQHCPHYHTIKGFCWLYEEEYLKRPF